MTEFYLTIPSNTHIGNKTCDFRVELPDVIKLSGQWDVALAQIQYPKSWNNVTEEPDLRPFFNKNDIFIMLEDSSHRSFQVTIPTSHYDTVNDLLSVIADKTEEKVKQLLEEELVKKTEEDGEEEESTYVTKLKMVPRAIFWNFDPVQKRVTVKFKQDVVSAIRLSEHLQYMLGFEERDLYNWNMYKDIAKYPMDMRAGVDALYVYCDLIENQIVGNTREPLLRILPVQGNYGEIVDQDFVARHYIPLLKKEFSTVQISIKSDCDVLIPFAFGKVIVKLHFKKRENKDLF